MVYVGEEALTQIVWVTAVVVVRVDTYDLIKIVVLKRQPLRGVCLNRVNRVARDTERIEERTVFDGVAPQIDSVGVKPVFAGE